MYVCLFVCFEQGSGPFHIEVTGNWNFAMYGNYHGNTTPQPIKKQEFNGGDY